MKRALSIVAAAVAITVIFGHSAKAGISNGDSIVLATSGSTTGLIPGHGSSLLGQGNSGGEFLLTDNGTIPASKFITFCVEYSEHFSPGGTYNLLLSDSSVNGLLVGGDRYGNVKHYKSSDNSYDPTGQVAPGYTPLLPETKWLFEQYATGALPAYYNGAGANAVQLAIWYLQGQIANTYSPDGRPTLSSNAAAQGLVTLALGHTTFSSTAVQIAQLWTGAVYQNGQGQWVGTGNSQDQIIYNPTGGTGNPNAGVPEPASLAVWSGMLLLGAVVTARKRRAARS